MATFLEHKQKWLDLRLRLQEQFGKRPNMEAILFLIGVQELGKPQSAFSKEQKVDLMHVAVCTLLVPDGYYQRADADPDGWPAFKELKPIPAMDLKDQDFFLQERIIRYFEHQGYGTPMDGSDMLSDTL